MSDLIEQLGGYAAAKEVFEQVKARDHKYAQNFERPALDRALLEYRRANNIFEVGDWVVLSNMHSLETVCKIVRVENLTPKIKASEITYFLDNSLGCWLFQIEHATDAEIKAGHRLPQLEVLNDIDIPPNTIILGDK